MASSGNFCTWNPINAQGGGTPDLTRSGTLTNGNLNYNPGSYGIIIGSVGVQTGKWYWELRATGANASGPVVGWLNERHTSGGSGAPSPGYSSPSSATNAQFLMIYMIPGSGPAEITAGTPSGSSSGADTDKSGITTNDIIGVAGDFDNDKWYFSINGSFTDFRSGQDPASGTNPLCSGPSGGGLTTFTRVSGLTWYPTYGNWSASGKASYTNFGQDSTFGGEITAGGNADESGFGDFKYSVPAGFKAMCSGNLPISDDIDPSQTDDDIPTKQFNTVLYTGNGGTQSIDVGFQPDLLWFKNRGSSNSWVLFDSTRGVTKTLNSDGTGAESTGAYTNLSAFTSTGFNLSGGGTGDVNQSSANLLAYCWRANGGTTASNSNGSITSTVQANQAAGFSIVTYTGTGSVATVGHGLGVAPKWIIVKNRDTSKNWACYHVDYNSSGQRALLLNTGGTDLSNYWNGTQPTSSVYSVGTETEVNQSSNAIVAYCWANIEGYQKFGSYEGNGNADGPFVYTGFRPRMLFTMRTDTTSGFRVRNTASETSNPTQKILWWTYNTAETSNSVYKFDILSNGFKVRTSQGDFNADGSLYVYGAWGDVPTKYNNSF